MAKKEPIMAVIVLKECTSLSVVKIDLPTVTVTSSSKIVQLEAFRRKLCCVIGHIPKVGAASKCISLPCGGPPETIQENLVQFTKWKLNDCVDNYFFIYRKIKHSQIVSGVKWYNFWMSTFTWDFINYLIPSLLTVLLFAIAKVESFSSK